MCSLHLASLKHVLPQPDFPEPRKQVCQMKSLYFRARAELFLEAVLPAQAAQIEATEDPPLPYGTC